MHGARTSATPRRRGRAHGAHGAQCVACTRPSLLCGRAPVSRRRHALTPPVRARACARAGNAGVHLGVHQRLAQRVPDVPQPWHEPPQPQSQQPAPQHYRHCEAACERSRCSWRGVRSRSPAAPSPGRVRLVGHACCCAHWPARVTDWCLETGSEAACREHVRGCRRRERCVLAIWIRRTLTCTWWAGLACPEEELLAGGINDTEGAWGERAPPLFCKVNFFLRNIINIVTFF